MSVDDLLKVAEMRRKLSQIRRSYNAAARSEGPGGASSIIRDVLERLEADLSEATSAPDIGGNAGKKGELVVAGKGTNCPTTETIEYRVVELSKLIPSHMPFSDFRPDPRYPQQVQERRYDVDRREQLKVTDNAKPDCFVPELIVNDEPTGLNGTPVVTPDGVVLSGNGRTMLLQVIYGRYPNSVKAYQRVLKERGKQFGLKDIGTHRLRQGQWRRTRTLQQPVLVRVLAQKGRTREELADLVRKFNEGLTQLMDPVTASVAHGRRVTDRIVDRLSAMGDETFLEFVRSDPHFLRLVQEDGLIPQEMMGSFVERDVLEGTDRITKEGARWIQSALLGRAIPDAVSIELLDLNVRDALTASVPYILQAATGNVDEPEKWSPVNALPHAIRLWARAKAAKKKSMRTYVDQLALFPLPSGVVLNEATAAIATALLQRPGTRQHPSGWRNYAAKVADSNTYSMFGDHPVSSFAGSFGISPDEYTGIGITPAGSFSMRGAR